MACTRLDRGRSPVGPVHGDIGIGDAIMEDAELLDTRIPLSLVAGPQTCSFHGRRRVLRAIADPILAAVCRGRPGNAAAHECVVLGC